MGIYIILGFFAVEVAYFSACRPFWGYWSVPPIHGGYLLLCLLSFNTNEVRAMLVVP